MEKDITPIETVYNGYRFRSRLEARWAVFFDTLELEYQYEPEGYDLTKTGQEILKYISQGGEDLSERRYEGRWDIGNKGDIETILRSRSKYLPDFYIPVFGSWIEVKPHEPTHRDEVRYSLFGDCIRQCIYVVFGQIPIPDDSTSIDMMHICWPWWDNFQMFCECPCCGSLGIQFDGRSRRNEHKPGCEIVELDKAGKSHPVYGRTDDKVYNVASKKLMAAYTAARQARFEHNETGRS